MHRISTRAQFLDNMKKQTFHFLSCMYVRSCEEKCVCPSERKLATHERSLAERWYDFCQPVSLNPIKCLKVIITVIIIIDYCIPFPPLGAEIIRRKGKVIPTRYFFERTLCVFSWHKSTSSGHLVTTPADKSSVARTSLFPRKKKNTKQCRSCKRIDFSSVCLFLCLLKLLLKLIPSIFPTT